MRNTLFLLTVLSVLSLSPLHAAEPAAFDFEELMEAVEFDLNEMQASISLEEPDSAIELANRLEQAFGRIEGFFAGWGYAEDAVLSAQQYQERARHVVELIEHGDYNQAYEVSVEFSNHCKACHDNYKPLPH
ncbi:MAG TPA: hypothetical protein VNR18_00850 [Hyphomicrobiales bacterium]|nr:hypothetical protein [Hyphomicrobiales bacterium]